LGVDLLPHKTCSYDCVYCQVGRTTCKTVERREWVPWEPVLEELRGKLDSNPDIVTFSGSGEPTLHARLGEAIEAVKGLTDVPVAVLTNGSLLWMPEVREALLRADIVVPSLDAPDERLFRKINRPDPSLDFERIVEGLVEFRREYRGRFLLEVFLLDGLNTSDDALRRMAETASRIGPDRIQINTVQRPPAETYARAIPPDRLEGIAGLFGEKAEIVVPFEVSGEPAEFTAHRKDVLEMIRRRPCTLGDLASGLGIHASEAQKYIGMLTAEGLVVPELVSGSTYYRASTP